MYAESGLMFPYFHSFDQEVQLFDEFCPNANSLGISSLVQTSTISDYNLGEEGDLFNAHGFEPVIEQPFTGLDLMTISDMESSIGSGQLLSEVFYACKNDILANEVLNIEIPSVKMDESFIGDERLVLEGLIKTSLSSSSLRPNFMDFSVMDFDEVYGMRRAFSEGDIKNLDNGHISLVQSLTEKPRVTSSEARKEKLFKYWSKKSKRNFGRKIKYACRKALADSQPRVRGRFAKTE